MRRFGSLVDKGDVDATGQEGHLAEARDQRVPVVFQHLEDGVVAHEGLDRAGVVRVALADHLDLGDRDAALEALTIDLAVALDLGLHPRAQGVDRADADAVQTAGDLVAAAAELAAGVQLGHDHRHRGHTGLLLDVHRDAGAVVLDGDAVVLVDGDADACRSDPAWPRRWSCPPPRRPCGAAPCCRCRRCTCPGGGARPPDLPAPGSDRHCRQTAVSCYSSDTTSSTKQKSKTHCPRLRNQARFSAQEARPIEDKQSHRQAGADVGVDDYGRRHAAHSARLANCASSRVMPSPMSVLTTTNPSVGRSWFAPA